MNFTGLDFTGFFPMVTVIVLLVFCVKFLSRESILKQKIRDLRYFEQQTLLEKIKSAIEAACLDNKENILGDMTCKDISMGPPFFLAEVYIVVYWIHEVSSMGDAGVIKKIQPERVAKLELRVDENIGNTIKVSYEGEEREEISLVEFVEGYRLQALCEFISEYKPLKMVI